MSDTPATEEILFEEPEVYDPEPELTPDDKQAYQPIRWPKSLKTFKVVCRLGTMDVDGGELNGLPELYPISGRVKITPILPNGRIRILEDDGLYRLLSAPERQYSVRELDGELFNTSDGTFGVNLLDPSSPNIDPQNFTYRAIVDPVIGSPFTVDFDGSMVFEGVCDIAKRGGIDPSSGVTSLEKRVEVLEKIVSEMTKE